MPNDSHRRARGVSRSGRSRTPCSRGPSQRKKNDLSAHEHSRQAMEHYPPRLTRQHRKPFENRKAS